ncbi:hypothetical protein BDV96DRAFT_262578 [Lophiotrema nucula]|uniref:Homeodomain-like protein n=1 Tax=Lophiotrema nucula TaxID=690887 RepID=A0A6A5YNM8_9PLEO|nr:hypothetical protein BDV96DRAFT_262578 [Lophiotrema nucula]
MNTSGHQNSTPTRWREEEDNILRAYVKQYTDIGCATDWSFVAEKLPRRTNKDCRKRWVNHVSGGLRKGPWEADEDMMLLDAVAQHGQKWTLVASEVGSRSADRKSMLPFARLQHLLVKLLITLSPECAKRWQHNLDPRLDHQRWTPKEDELLLESVERYGREWRKIQEKHYSTRSANDLKNRFTILSKKIRSRASSRSGPTLGHSSSSSVIVVEEQDQESTNAGTDSGASHPSSSMSPEGGSVGVYNPKNIHVDLDEIMQSTPSVQQQREQQMRPGQQQQALSQGQAGVLLSLGQHDQSMALDDLEHAPTASVFPWATTTTSPSTTVPRPFTSGDFPNPIMPNSLTTMLNHPYHHSQTDSGDSNGLGSSSSHVGDSNMGGLLLEFDAMDTVPGGMKNGQLHSLLVQRAGRLRNCSPGGRVLFQGEGCDMEVLNYLLDVLLPVRHLVKIEINM